MPLAAIGRGKRALMLTAVFVIWQHAAFAQQGNQQPTSNSQDSQDQRISGTQESQDPNGDSSQPPIPVVASSDNVAPIHEVGRASALRETISPLRWGPLYISSAQFMQAGDRLQGVNGTQSDSELVSMMSTTLVADKQFERSRIALQYNPNIAIANGQLYTNFSSQLLTFDTQMNLSSRWTFGISDSFTASRSQNLLINNYFSVDPLTNTTLRGQIFNNAGGMIIDSAQLSFGYALTPQTTLGIAPNYSYNSISEMGHTIIGNQYGSDLALTHVTARGDSFGITYGHQITQISRQATVDYDVLGFSYSRKITLRWALGGNFSAVNVTSPATHTNYWTSSGAVQLIRTMNKSTFALAFLQTQGLNQVIINGTSERADAQYILNWTPRLSSSLGFGYFFARQVQNYTGKYGVASLQYRLTQSLGLITSYSHQYQTGAANQILAGTTDAIVAGISWAPTLQQ